MTKAFHAIVVIDRGEFKQDRGDQVLVPRAGNASGQDADNVRPMGRRLGITQTANRIQ